MGRIEMDLHSPAFLLKAKLWLFYIQYNYIENLISCVILIIKETDFAGPVECTWWEGAET